MKKLFLFSFLFLLAFSSKAQTQLWGMTSAGGQYGAGIIFKTDGSGNNEIVQHSFLLFTGATPLGSLVQANGGKLYGMTQMGGANDMGVIFQFDAATSTYVKKFDFDMTNGANPTGNLLEASDGKLYGTASMGDSGRGVLFQFDPVTSAYTKKLEFAEATGYFLSDFMSSVGTLIQASDGKLYGMTNYGGANGVGVIFQYDISTNLYADKIDLIHANGDGPTGSLLQASDGKLYGMTQGGGANNRGVIFQYDPVTNTYTKKIDLSDANGSSPFGSLIQANGGKLYGMTQGGGANNMGVIFQYDPVTNTYTKKIDLNDANGSSPFGSLLQASDGKLYGMTSMGGTNSFGVIFQFDPATNTYIKKIDFNDAVNGSMPAGSLIQANDGKLYGMTQTGGSEGMGVLLQFDPTTSPPYTKKNDFDWDYGYNPAGALTQASDGKLYGMTNTGGINNVGVIFQFDTTTSTYIKKLDFDLGNGGEPSGSLMLASDGKFYGTAPYGEAGYGVLFQFDPVTSTYTKKFEFDSTGYYISDIVNSSGTLIQASDGKLYGISNAGGANGIGVIFQYDPVTNVYTKKIDLSDATIGNAARSSLIQASDGNLYGMTSYGGANNKGVIFQYDPVANTYTKKVDLSSANGSSPYGSLIQANDGRLYGMTTQGGANNRGVIFQYNPATNTFTKKIDLDDANGSNPQGSLMQASDGKLYGMTSSGGANGFGVFFTYDPVANTYTRKIDFNDSDNGSWPLGSLMQAADGKLYGITTMGGANGGGVLFKYDLSSSNTYTDKIAMIAFDGTPNGADPWGSLMKASDGKLYGTAANGGANNAGVIFQYDPVANVYTKKIDLISANGTNPSGSLIQASDGKLYGMTQWGGANDGGVIFQYDLATNIYTKKTDFTYGSHPFGSLVQASNGKLYGMTNGGGVNGTGVIFQYDPVSNTYTKEIDLSNANGSAPFGSLIQANNGKLYGMTLQGGINNRGVIFQYDPITNIYTEKISLDSANGDFPTGTLMQANDGKLYGMTTQGGANNAGVIFQYDPVTNIYTKKIDFTGTSYYPNLMGSLLQASDGKIYGMTAVGGVYIFSGIIFQYDPLADTFTKKLDFNGANGSFPRSSLIEINTDTVQCPTDLNSDNITNNADFLLLLGQFNQSCTCPEDIDQSGTVDNIDFLLLLGEFNQICQ